jgi:tetratricopeptide (TPR) repeat protein
MSESDAENGFQLHEFNHALVQTVTGVFPRNYSEIQNASGIPEYACLRSLMLEPSNPVMWNALALVYLAVERLEEAEKAIISSLDISTSNAWTWRIWGDILLMDKRPFEAEQAFRMSLELESKDPHALYELFLLQMSRNALYEAADTLFQLLEDFPNNQKLWDCFTSCISSHLRNI